jgi:hypothetical protein
MKPLANFNGIEVWYTEVQVQKAHFWFICTDPFLEPDNCKYNVYMQKQYTLAKALELFALTKLGYNPSNTINITDNTNCI